MEAERRFEGLLAGRLLVFAWGTPLLAEALADVDTRDRSLKLEAPRTVDPHFWGRERSRTLAEPRMALPEKVGGAEYANNTQH